MFLLTFIPLHAGSFKTNPRHNFICKVFSVTAIKVKDTWYNVAIDPLRKHGHSLCRITHILYFANGIHVVLFNAFLFHLYFLYTGNLLYRHYPRMIHVWWCLFSIVSHQRTHNIWLNLFCDGKIDHWGQILSATLSILSSPLALHLLVLASIGDNCLKLFYCRLQDNNSVILWFLLHLLAEILQLRKHIPHYLFTLRYSFKEKARHKLYFFPSFTSFMNKVMSWFLGILQKLLSSFIIWSYCVHMYFRIYAFLCLLFFWCSNYSMSEPLYTVGGKSVQPLW